MLNKKPFSQFTKSERRRLLQTAFRIVQDNKKLRRNSIINQILGAYFGLAESRFYPGKSKADIERIQASKEFAVVCKKLEQSVVRMKKQRLITIQSAADGLTIALTSEGRQESLKREVLSVNDRLPSGIFCYVTFDIPEAAKAARQMLRTFLRQAKFTMAQKSVWKTDRNVGKPLLALIRSARVENWVSVIEGRELS